MLLCLPVASRPPVRSHSSVSGCVASLPLISHLHSPALCMFSLSGNLSDLNNGPLIPRKFLWLGNLQRPVICFLIIVLWISSCLSSRGWRYLLCCVAYGSTESLPRRVGSLGSGALSCTRGSVRRQKAQSVRLGFSRLTGILATTQRQEFYRRMEKERRLQCG